MSPRQQKGRRGAKAAARGRSRGRRLSVPESRVPLIGFGALFLLLFLGFAVTQGIGQPDAEGDTIAVVEDAPDTSVVAGSEDDPGEITREEFDRALEQAAARARAPEVPREGTDRYRDLAQAALNDLLDTIWIQGEAAEEGIEVSQRQIDDQLEQIKSDNFGSEREFQAFVERSGFTEEDVQLRVALQILSTRLQNAVTQSPEPVTADDVEEYYEAAQEQYELPETRDVRLVLNRDEAKVEQAKSRLEEDSTAPAWDRIARKFSTDPASQANGGQRPGLTEGLLEEPLNREVFAADEGEIVGPVETDLGFYVFQVQKITPARTQELGEVQGQIRTQLEQQAEQEAFTTFIEDYGSKWQSRTVCNEELFDIATDGAPGGALDRCSNFGGSPHPENAPPGCYAEEPRGGRPPACPAPIVQLTPAVPGSISALTPQGTRLPQRPRPAGLVEPPPAPTLPGAVPVPPGTTP